MFTPCLLALLKDPHWRPRFRYFHWAVGLVGFVLCTSIMFVIDWRYALGAWLLTLLVLALVVRTNAQTDWGSALVGLRFQLAMRSLTGIDIKAHLDENWRTPPSPHHVVNTRPRPKVPFFVVVTRSVVVDRPAPTPQWGLDCAFGLDLALHAFGPLPLNNKEWFRVT